MAGFTDREKFIQALTVFTVSPEAKTRSTSERSDILNYIRNKYCKSITNDDWALLSSELNKNKEWILDSITAYKNADPEIDVDVDEVNESNTDLDDEFGLDDDDDQDDDEPEVDVDTNLATMDTIDEPELDDDDDEPDLPEPEPSKKPKTNTLRGIIKKK